MEADKKNRLVTPNYLFEYADRLYGPFDLDVCAENAKVAKVSNYITPKMDGLSIDWNGKKAWCNPPYGRGHISQWVNSAIRNIHKDFCVTRSGTTRNELITVTLLLPASTGSAWFYNLINSGYCQYVTFVTGRITFLDPDTLKVTKHPARFDSMLVTLQKVCHTSSPLISLIRREKCNFQIN